MIVKSKRKKLSKQLFLPPRISVNNHDLDHDSSGARMNENVLQISKTLTLL